MDAVAYDLQTLSGALEQTAVLLRESSDPGKLQQAGRTMCHALTAVLREDGDDEAHEGLLAKLRHELTDPDLRNVAWPLRRSDVAELKRLLHQPVIADALRELGYDPPPAIGVLVGNVIRGVKQIAAGPHRQLITLPASDDPAKPSHLDQTQAAFDQAQTAIDELRSEICSLSETGEDSERLGRLIGWGRGVIGQILLAAVVVPVAAAAWERFNPNILRFLSEDVLGLLRELGDHLGKLWILVSIGAVGAIPRRSSDLGLSVWRADIDQLPSRDDPQRVDPQVNQVAVGLPYERDAEGHRIDASRPDHPADRVAVGPPYERDLGDPPAGKGTLARKARATQPGHRPQDIHSPDEIDPAVDPSQQRVKQPDQSGRSHRRDRDPSRGQASPTGTQHRGPPAQTGKDERVPER